MDIYQFYKNPNELNSYEDRLYHVPQLAYEALRENPKRKDKSKLEDAIATSSLWSLEYSQHVKEGRFLKGEPIILQSPANSYAYACWAIKGRFKNGEQIISTSAEWSFHYALDVLEKRFLLGEDEIAKNLYFSLKYAEDVINGPFQKGEEIIATSPIDSLKYAKLIGKRFPKGEGVIRQKTALWDSYQRFLASL